METSNKIIIDFFDFILSSPFLNLIFYTHVFM